MGGCWREDGNWKNIPEYPSLAPDVDPPQKKKIPPPSYLAKTFHPQQL